MKIIIQSYGNIITNSSSETFCISNGCTTELQQLIDSILKIYGINNSSIIITEIVDYNDLYSRAYRLEELSEFANSTYFINSSTFLQLIESKNFEDLEKLCLEYNTSLLEIVTNFNDYYDGAPILTKYSVESDTLNTDELKPQIENLQNLFYYDTCYC